MKQPAEILDRMPDAGPAQAQSQSRISSTGNDCEHNARTCSGSAQKKMPDQQFAEMQSQAMIARPKVQGDQGNGVAQLCQCKDRTQGTPLPLLKLLQQQKLPKHMRFIPTREPSRVKAFVAQTATAVKRRCCDVIHQPMNSAQIYIYIYIIIIIIIIVIMRYMESRKQNAVEKRLSESRKNKQEYIAPHDTYCIRYKMV
jgi:hypothetical protein